MNRFLYASAAILMLSLAYHLGAGTAVAQAPANPVVGIATNNSNNIFAITANGDVYTSLDNVPTGPWALASNVFSSGPTPARQESWGQLKSRYAPNHGPTSQTPTNR